MASFSGVDDDAVERFSRRGMRVRRFEKTESIEWDVERYRQAVTAINEIGPDLVVIGGDMIDETDRSDQLEAFREVTRQFEVDVHFVPGNHDICADGTVPTTDSLEWYRSTFGAEHWVHRHDSSNTVDKVDTSTTLIAVNSAVLDDPRHLPGAFEAEMEWLEGALAERSPGRVIVFSHHPPFVDDADEPDSYWNLPLERRRPFLDLLADHHVDLLLCGHRHQNDQTSYRGVEIVTSAATGFPLGIDPPGFRVVEVTQAGVTHRYYPVTAPGWEDIGGQP